MKLYRFGHIQNVEQLLKTLEYINDACHKLCKISFDKYFPISGNIGVFCHYDDEYETLKLIQEELCDITDSFNDKYFRLKQPIVIPKRGDLPKAVYKYLYIRAPDPYRYQVGDLDFYLDDQDFKQLKQSIISGDTMAKGARVYGRSDLDMIELYNPDIDALAYVANHKMPKSNELHI